MPEQLQKLIQPVRSRWMALTRDQKLKIGGAALIVLIALGLTVYLTTRVVYEPYFQRFVSTQDMLDAEAAIKAAGIKTKIGADGASLLVDRSKLGDARYAINANPATSSIPFTYEDALSLSGMSTTETQKRELAIRAKQSELAEDLKRFEGVTDATVQLVIPDTGRFLNSQRNQSSASVIVNASRQLTAAEGEVIAQHVTRAVEGLLIDNVEVVDNRMQKLFSGSARTEGGTAGSVTDQRAQETERTMWNLQLQLMPLFDDVQAAPNFVYPTLLSTQQETMTYTPPVDGNETGLASDERRESTKAEGGTPADEPGLGSNDQASPGYETGDNTSSSAKSDIYEVNSYLYNTDHVQTSVGPGSYSRADSTIAVTGYRYVDYYQDAYLEEDTTRTTSDWENLKTATTDSAFVDDPDQERYVNMVSRATGLSTDNITFSITEVRFFHDSEETPADIQQIIMFAVLALLILLLALGFLRRHKTEEEEETEPELSVEDLLVSTQLEEAREEAEALEGIDYARESEVKKQIERFVTEKPEAVAALLRNWLNNEEW